MHNFSKEELEVLKSGDENFKPFIKLDESFYTSDIEDKKVLSLAFKEFERIYSNWRYFLFDKKLARFSCKSPSNKSLLNKLIKFCHQHKINIIDLLLKLNELSLQSKVNKDAFYQLQYMASDVMLNSYLEKRILSKTTKVENTFANVKNNEDLTSIIKSYLIQNGFTITEDHTDRYFQTVIAALREFNNGKRINCSQNIKDMCTCLLKSKTIIDMLK